MLDNKIKFKQVLHDNTYQNQGDSESWNLKTGNDAPQRVFKRTKRIEDSAEQAVYNKKILNSDKSLYIKQHIIHIHNVNW